MNKHKKRLIILITTGALLILILVFLRDAPTSTGDVAGKPWHYWLTLGFWSSVVLYALSIRCPNSTCRRGQVFRGFSITDLSWPTSNCYYCGVPLSTKYKNGKPIDP
jgi:hypothetical protein